MNETLKGEVSGLAFGGQGIIRQAGLVTFVPFAAIGDTLSYELVQKKKNFATGKILKIISPGPDRVDPKCPYFTSCGGCQLQHLTYPAQLAAKRQWIADAIQRQAKLTDIVIPPVEPATQKWDYRRKINLTLRPKGYFYEIGYIATDHTSVLEVEQCAIFAEKSDPILKQVSTIAKKLKCSDETEARGTLLKNGDSSYLIHFHFKTIPSNIQTVLEEAKLNHPNLAGIVATSPKTSFRVGNFETVLKLEGLHFEFSPQAFIQNHPEQSLKIYRKLCEIGVRKTPKIILDLYCGIGVSTLMLARILGKQTKLIGIEANSEAVRLAKENAIKNKLDNTSFSKGFVEAVLPSLLKNEKPDMVIVNPPREGLDQEAVATLCKNQPKTIVYISCMPATLARDLKSFCASGYTVVSIQGYDMFPQTTHVETLAVLESQ